MRRLLIVLPLVALIFIQTPLVADAARTATGAPSTPLEYAGTWASSYTYTLHALTSCEIGDGLAVVKDVGTVPVRLRAVSMLFEGGAGSYAANTTYQLVSFRRATTEGQLGASFHLAGLDLGRVIGPAVGGILQPTKTSGLWYIIVARVKVKANHSSKWGIDGLRVSYSLGAKSFAQVLRQSVQLPTLDGCS